MTKRICVFCGSNKGHDPRFEEAAAALGTALARASLGLVFGGGAVGLMGITARAALAEGGSVIGVIPRRLFDREVGLKECSELRVVETMHERKAMMAELSDGFIALPGGIGTLDELCEIMTWAQLGIHGKPIALLNTAGYWNGFLSFLDSAVKDGFMSETSRKLLWTEHEPERALERLRGMAGRPPAPPLAA